MLFQIEAGLM